MLNLLKSNTNNDGSNDQQGYYRNDRYRFFGLRHAFSPDRETLSINSKPNEAAVYLNGNKRGKTPLSLLLNPTKTYTVKYKKSGYEPETRVIRNEIGVKWLVLDIVGGGIPILVDAVSENWMTLKKQRVNVNLNEK